MTLPPEVKPAAWGAVGGAVLTMVVGFSLFGWVLGSTADQMAMQRAHDAVVSVLAPVCADRALSGPDSALHIAAIKDSRTTADKRRYVQSREWAPAFDNNRVNTRVADECARIIGATEVEDAPPTAL